MKTLILFFIFNISILSAIEPNELLNRYDALFHMYKVQWEDDEYSVIDFEPINYTYDDSSFVINNIDELRYILKNFSEIDYLYLESIENSIELQNQFITQLKSDSNFVSYIYKYFSQTLEPDKYPKDKIKFSYVHALSVKFFQIIDIDHNNSYIGKVCSGDNLISQTETVRNPHVEAFCFAAVFNNYQSEEFNLIAEFREAISQLYSVNLGNDKEEKILRAQGAVMLLMKNNKKLEQMLRTEYESKKDYLPFIIVE